MLSATNNGQQSSLDDAIDLGEVYRLALSSYKIRRQLSGLKAHFDASYLTADRQRLVDTTDRTALASLLNFFSSLNGFILTWIDGVRTHNKGLESRKQSIESVQDLLSLIGFISNPQLPHGIAFQMGSDKVLVALSKLTLLLPESSVTKIKASMQTLLQEHGLGAGFSLSRIWRSLRSEISQTQYKITLFKALKEAADKFDKISQSLSVPTPQMLQLRLSFAKAFEQVGEPTEQEIELKISDVEAITGAIASDNKPVQHYFCEAFGSILRLRWLSHVKRESKGLAVSYIRLSCFQCYLLSNGSG